MFRATRKDKGIGRRWAGGGCSKEENVRRNRSTEMCQRTIQPRVEGVVVDDIQNDAEPHAVDGLHHAPEL